MKRADIKVGGVYAYASGNQKHIAEGLYAPKRCGVLDMGPVYNIKWDTVSPTLNEKGMSHPEWVGVRFGSQPGRQDRILVAVELFTYEWIEVQPDPEYADPWERPTNKPVRTGNFWVPYAALPRELYDRWEEEVELERKREEVRAASAIEYRERRIAERKRKDAELADAPRKQRERDLEKAHRVELWETRIAPQLADAGIDIETEVMFDWRTDKIKITDEALARLLGRMEDGSS